MFRRLRQRLKENRRGVAEATSPPEKSPLTPSPSKLAGRRRFRGGTPATTTTSPSTPTAESADNVVPPKSSPEAPSNSVATSPAVSSKSLGAFHLGRPFAKKDKHAHSSRNENAIDNEEDDAAETWNRVTKEAARWDKQGTEHFEKGEYDQAFLCYEKALTLKRNSLQPQTSSSSPSQDEASLMASVATSINNMTYLRQRSGKATSDETMAAYLQSLQMKREILGPHHLSVGKTLNNIGSVFYLQRDYEPALKAYMQAYEIMEKQLGEAHLDVGTVLSNIGDVYFAMKDREASKEHYRKALDVRWGALGPSDPKVVRLMEQLAFLETGRQPARDSQDLSDSEGEEYAMEDRMRHERFQEEVRVLHDELEADMKFFDLLERKMAIDMVKDKARMLKKMREVGTMTMEEVMEVSETTDYSEQDVPVVETLVPAVVGTTPTEPTRKAARVKKTRVTRATAAVLPDVSNAQSQRSSATSFLDRGGSVMTVEERKEALKSVRSRLANLRAARQAQNGYSAATQPTNGTTAWEAQPESLQAS